MSDAPTPAPGLPERASLEQLRKRAKELLRAVRAGDETAARRVRAVVPGAAPKATPIALADAQHVIARELGFESWPRLVRHVEAMRPASLAAFERLAEQVARAYVAGDAAAIRELNWARGTSFVWDEEPERMRRRLTRWYASPTRDAALALADARHLVARQAGADDWDELARRLAPLPAGAAPAGAAPALGRASSPFYRVDEAARAVRVRGPLSERDWDDVFAAMREMRLTGLEAAGQISDAALARLSRLDQVTRLDLTGAKRFTYAGLRHLARLPLRHLDLGGWGTELDDEGLRVLGHLPELRAFSAVWAQGVSDAGIAHLAACPHLESVNLMGTPTGDGALRALAGKARLRALDAGTRVTAAGLALLRELPLLARPLPAEVLAHARAGDGTPTFVSLHPAAFVRGGLGALAGLDGLYSLRFFTHDRGVPPVRGAALAPLAALGGLESLWCDPADDAMAVIASMPRLRALSCQHAAVGDDAWAALARSTTLETIWGSRDPGIGGGGLAALAAIPALRALGVGLQRADAAGLAALARFPALRELTPMGLGDAAFAHVGRCAALEALTCMNTADIGDAATAHLAGLRRLRTYYAGDTRIGDGSLEVLATLPALERVELWACPAVTNAGLAALARAPRLRRVAVEGAPLVTRAAAAAFPPHVAVELRG